MKKIKPSNILLLSIGVAFLVGSVYSEQVTAAPSTNYNRSVREMMARRRGGNFGLQQTAEQPTPRVAKKADVPTKYASSSPSYTKSSFSLFGNNGDKDGSLFPGGDCASCHDSGPIFDTGPCETCDEPKEEIVAAPAPVCPVCVEPKLTNYAISYNDYVVQAVARNC